MNILHGNLFDNLWAYRATGDLDIETAHLNPDWGLRSLTESLGPLNRGQVVLITGGRHVGTTSLARAVALANAERGLQVDYFVSDHGEDEEARRIASAALGLRNGVNVEPEHGIFTPVTHLPGCIRVHDSRPLLLDGEDSDHSPDVVVCDEIDSYVDVKNYALKRRLVLERLRVYAQRKQCVVIAVSKEYEGGEGGEDFDNSALWERYVDTHLEILKGLGTIDVIVHQHCGQWPEHQIIPLVDQRDIGRLSDIAQSPDLDLPGTGEMAPPTDDLMGELAHRIDDLLRMRYEYNQRSLLQRFHMITVFTAHSEDIENIGIYLDEITWDEAPLPRRLAGREGWTFDAMVTCQIAFMGKELYTSFSIRGPVTVTLDRLGQIDTVDIEAMLVPALRASYQENSNPLT